MAFRLRDLREDRDLRQTDVARATGLDQKTLSNYETGKTAPDMHSLIKLADFFGVSLDYLTGRRDVDLQDNSSIASKLKETTAELESLIKALDNSGCTRHGHTH